MPETNKMICPVCGIEMNYHAEKLDYTAALVDPDAVDPDLDGVLEEVHTCPRCGKWGLGDLGKAPGQGGSASLNRLHRTKHHTSSGI